ncbi:MAG TPA: hypothetical protein VNA69_06745 [Thermoanaerobaculia bacterium]|nr:hypothetical protein [Thermoanaerobaculia bacterium]
MILTDGGDTSSISSYEDVQKLAREAAIPLYFIDLKAKYEAIERDLRAQFAIKYQVSDMGRSNEWRNVRVVINSPKLTARTIKGYFTP